MADQSNTETGNRQESSDERFTNPPHMSGDVRFSAEKSGPDYMNMARQYGGRVYEGVSQTMRDLPQRSRTFARDVDVQVRNSPWLSTAVVGIGSLLIGYLFGRSMKSRALPRRPSSLGLGYDSYDDAIDE